MIIGIQDLATTILKEIGQILRYTFEVIFDLLEFIFSIKLVKELFKLIGDVVEFTFTNTILKPMEYYWEYIGSPTYKVRILTSNLYFLKLLYISPERSILRID